MRNTILNIAVPTARLVEHPIDRPEIGKRDSEMLFGEEFQITDEFNGWARGVSLVDGYEGHIHLGQLTNTHLKPTHFVDRRITNAYEDPNFKTQPSLTLSFLSRVKVYDGAESVDGFMPVARGHDIMWIPEDHITKIDEITPNAEAVVDTAMMLNGTSYIYGGRSTFGMDCSALVQASLIRNGFECPRDCDQQMPVLGESVKGQNLQRGDLVYFSGHVGIMVDDKNILNATARYMCALTEPLHEMSGRYIIDGKDPILDIRRLSI